MKIEDLCGCSKGTLYHFWTLMVILDTAAKNLWFNTNLVVENQKPPSLITLPAVTLSVAATGLFYITELVMDEEDHYWKR